jgi:hypothetical protein
MKALTPILAAAAFAYPISLSAQTTYTSEIWVYTEDSNGNLSTTPTEKFDVSPDDLPKVLVPAGLQIQKRAVFKLVTFDSSGNIFDHGDEPIFITDPQVALTITTNDGDMLEGDTPRTRVGHPYTVNLTVTGLYVGAIDPTQVMEAATRVACRYDQHTFASGAVVSTAGYTVTNHNDSDITDNISVSRTFTPGEGASALGFAEGYSGEIIYSVMRMADATLGIDELELAKADVDIWPNATGSITVPSDKNGKTHAKVPAIYLSVNNIYPKGEYYLRITRLSDGSDDSPEVLRWGDPDQSAITPYTIADQAVLSKSTDGLDIFAENGDYKIELIEECTFGTTVLDTYEPIPLDRSVEINGVLTSAE